MRFEKAVIEDTGQLSELRLAYLIEDNGKLEEKDLDIIKHSLPDYFVRNLNNTIYGYVAREEKEIVACALLLVTERPMSPRFITGKTGTVLNVYTKPEYRHKGYEIQVSSDEVVWRRLADIGHERYFCRYQSDTFFKPN